jgi:hypothetical protein
MSGRKRKSPSVDDELDTKLQSQTQSQSPSQAFDDQNNVNDYEDDYEMGGGGEHDDDDDGYATLLARTPEVKQLVQQRKSSVRRSARRSSAMKPPLAAAAAAATSAAAKKKETKKQSRRRRHTMARIDDALTGSDMRDTMEDGQRRSKRRRFKPLKYWKNERFIYTRTEDPNGMGEYLPTIAEEQPVAKAAPTPERKQRPMTKKKNKKKKKVAAKKKKKKKQMSDDSDDDETDSDDEEQQTPKEALPQLSINGASRVFKRSSDLKLVGLAQTTAPGAEPVAPNMLPRAAAAMIASDPRQRWTSGVMTLAPRSFKQMETTRSDEVYFVVSAERNSLRATVNDTVATVSRGDMFSVPFGNSLALHNTSKTKTVSLFWTLVKRDLSAAVAAPAAAAAASAMEDDDDDDDDDEEDED